MLQCTIFHCVDWSTLLFVIIFFNLKAHLLKKFVFLTEMGVTKKLITPAFGITENKTHVMVTLHFGRATRRSCRIMNF